MENHYNCIYMYVNKINNHKYIGQTKDFRKRHNQHKAKCNDRFPIDVAINKYGIENFDIVILKENLQTQCLLNFWECYYIGKFNCLANENYNISNGGFGGNPYAGKTEDEMEVFREKTRERFLGKEHTEEWKKNHSIFMVNNNPMSGKNHTEESKKKMREKKKKKKVAQYDLNGNLVKIFESLRDAERNTGIDHSHISNCCKGKQKMTGKKDGEKFIWRFCENK